MKDENNGIPKPLAAYRLREEVKKLKAELVALKIKHMTL